jgi:RNA polymerase sigma factor (sigma-70 family)
MPDARLPEALAADAAALADLLAGCRRGEALAQRRLYDRFAGPMLVVARRYAPNLADAEDALQDAFVKIFQRLGDYRGQGSLAGWIRRIVISTSLDAWDRRRVRRTDFDLDHVVVQHVPAPDSSALDQLAVAEVRALIDQLPPGCRHVLLLYTVEGYSHAEIGTLLGVGESASKAQLSRARQRLMALVEAHSRERPTGLSAAASANAGATSPGDARSSRSESTAATKGAAFHSISALLFR